MAQSILDHPTFTVYPESHRCENCRYWLGDYERKIYARVSGEITWVGQCVALEESDDAPYADLDNGAEAFVFTPPQGRCRCFTMHPDVAQAEAEQAAMDADVAATYERLDRELMESAWAASGRV